MWLEEMRWRRRATRELGVERSGSESGVAWRGGRRGGGRGGSGVLAGAAEGTGEI